MKNPITPEGTASAQNPLPPVPTTKILAISHFMGTPMTPAQRAQIMPHEVHDTVNAYLAGKIDQWYHLAGESMEPRIEPTVHDLANRVRPRVVAPGHCTGWRAKAALAHTFAPGNYGPSVVGSLYALRAT